MASHVISRAGRTLSFSLPPPRRKTWRAPSVMGRSAGASASVMSRISSSTPVVPWSSVSATATASRALYSMMGAPGGHLPAPTSASTEGDVTRPATFLRPRRTVAAASASSLGRCAASSASKRPCSSATTSPTFSSSGFRSAATNPSMGRACAHCLSDLHSHPKL